MIIITTNQITDLSQAMSYKTIRQRQVVILALKKGKDILTCSESEARQLRGIYHALCADNPEYRNYKAPRIITVANHEIKVELDIGEDSYILDSVDLMAARLFTAKPFAISIDAVRYEGSSVKIHPKLPKIIV